MMFRRKKAAPVAAEESWPKYEILARTDNHALVLYRGVKFEMTRWSNNAWRGDIDKDDTEKYNIPYQGWAGFPFEVEVKRVIKEIDAALYRYYDLQAFNKLKENIK